MPSLIDIRRRVKAVKSTQQITKAMKMVSSSKLRRAQERIVKSRPYAKEMLRVFNNLATRTENTAHPLLNDDPEAGRALLILIEEMCEQLPDDERREIGAHANQLLANSQQHATRERLRKCLDLINYKVGVYEDILDDRPQSVGTS